MSAVSVISVRWVVLVFHVQACLLSENGNLSSPRQVDANGPIRTILTSGKATVFSSWRLDVFAQRQRVVDLAVAPGIIVLAPTDLSKTALW
jgi:hypothetical protein